MPPLAVLGAGQVGQAIARRAAEVGYDVTVGARTTDSPSLDVFSGDASIATGTFIGTAVVKTLDTMNCAVMVRPAMILGDLLVFLSGDSPASAGPCPTARRRERAGSDGSGSGPAA